MLARAYLLLFGRACRVRVCTATGRSLLRTVYVLAEGGIDPCLAIPDGRLSTEPSVFACTRTLLRMHATGAELLREKHSASIRALYCLEILPVCEEVNCVKNNSSSSRALVRERPLMLRVHGGVGVGIARDVAARLALEPSLVRLEPPSKQRPLMEKSCDF